MDLNNIVRCEDCNNYNASFRDCKAKEFKKISKETNCRSCDLYTPTIKKAFKNLIDSIVNH